ncbi:MAG: CDC27 family protein [Longimicrobiales bacterium]
MRSWIQMARHPTARRLHQRPATTADDVFIERVLETTVWARTHQRWILIAGATALAMFLIFLWYGNRRDRITERAALELTVVRQTMQSGNDALAVRDLERFVESYGSTPSAPEARLMLAEAYLDSNQAQKAITATQDQANDLESHTGVAAAFLQAEAHEVLNQFQQAEAVLLRVADRASFTFQKERALDAVARIRTEHGDAAGAVQAYDRLLELMPRDNQNRIVYEMRRAEAQARATSGT